AAPACQVSSPFVRATCFLTTDHLGSVRMVTDAAGTVISRHDYLPFGEEIPASVGNRSAVPGYGAGDGVPERFTGKERDGETGLDYFGARYFSGAQGRFMSPDPSNLGVEFMNPQSWNRYAYVGNNPLRRVDQNGLWWTETHILAIKEALPGLNSAELSQIMAGSSDADIQVIGVDAQIPAMSGVHHMGNSHDPLDVTMDFESRYVSSNQAEARVEQAKWIAEGHAGYSPKALLAFGRAQHPPADSTSPSHENYQNWGGCSHLPYGISIGGISCVGFKPGYHAFRERPSTFTGDRKAQTLDIIQMMFLDTFGAQALRQAAPNSEADRQSSHHNCLLDRATGQCVK
ncbi:MAG: RHS repeat-associated core domain-containing protein, partial [Bryobacteraceae bacterium]